MTRKDCLDAAGKAVLQGHQQGGGYDDSWKY